MLHAKLHFAEFAMGFVAPLIEGVEDLHEGHSTVNYAMALEDHACQQMEMQHKVKKKKMVSMYSFSDRHVGNSHSAQKGPAWRSNKGNLLANSWICQLY